MNLRKSIYFKPLCLLVAALFTCQCFYMERKLISTEEKVIGNGSQAYLYELEKVKTPSTQDPTIEYRIVKFPANRVESIDTYQKFKKVNIFNTILGGLFIGGFTGWTVTLTSSDDSFIKSYGLKGTYISALIGSLIVSAISINKAARKEEVKTSRQSLEKKPDATPIPAQNLPLEFILWTHGKRKGNAFKTRTDEQGIARIDLAADLKMTKFPTDHPLILYIYYLNPESQKKGILLDSLGPEK
ncbi:MAG TPA: hypothetical protein VK186_05655 [Candidatus Deferrimicrobium sp.]|nr:hypothetical protein [Candidatus Kapabacteria bacterium]HLP58292.1 hypothetical protein [Candidatus Deferrimicrobium sp.]